MWILYSLFSGVVVAIFLLSSTRLSERHGVGYGKFVMATLVVSSVISLLFACFVNLDIPFQFAWRAILSGVVFGFSIVPFFTSFRYLNALSISVIVQMAPVLVLTQSWLFLEEEMTMPQVFGFLLVLCGSTIAAVRSGERRKESFLGFLLILCGITLASTSYPLMKYVTSELSKGEIFMLNRIGMALSTLLLLCLRPSRKRMFGLLELDKREQILYLGTLSLNALATLCMLLAIAAQPPGMNTSLAILVRLGMAQIVLFAIFFFTKKDENIMKKGIGAGIAIFGLAILALS